MFFVTIGDFLLFSPNIGVVLEREALDTSPEQLFEAVRTAYSHMNDRPLVDACRGACGPLAHLRGGIVYEAYQKLLQEARIREAGETAKKTHTKLRRADYNAKRSALLLQMIESGVEYICVADGCGVHQTLTVDHIVPLSRGGTDELSNLQFLCRSHNSAKRDNYNG